MGEPVKEIKTSRPESKEEELGRKWYASLFVLTEQLGELVRPGGRNDFVLYYPFLGAILDYAELRKKPARLEALKKEIYKKPLIDQDSAREKPQELVEMTPLDGMKVLEIGGPFAQVLHLLGAEKAVCIDPAPSWPYQPEKEGYRRIFKRFDFTNLRKHVGKENFDIVLTREVLSTGSPLIRKAVILGGGEMVTYEFEFGRGKAWSDNEVYQGMLGACAQLTKKGGLNIHVGDGVTQPENFYEEIGLELVVKARAHNMTTFVFRKK